MKETITPMIMARCEAHVRRHPHGATLASIHCESAICGDAQHGRVEIVAVKHAATNMLAILLQQVAGIDLLNFARLQTRSSQHEESY